MWCANLTLFEEGSNHYSSGRECSWQTALHCQLPLRNLSEESHCTQSHSFLPGLHLWLISTGVFLFVCLFLNYYLFIYLFLAVLGLRFCARAFSSCGKRGPLFIAVRGPLTIAASLAAGHRLQTRRLSNCGSRAQSLCSMWDLPRPGLEPVSPALAGRFSTTAPPGKPSTGV